MDQYGSGKNAAAQIGSSISFGAGSRTCIGKNVSLLEMTKAVPQIVRKFDGELDGEEEQWSRSTIKCFRTRAVVLDW